MMLRQLETEFARYFLLNIKNKPSKARYGSLFVSEQLLSERDAVSEILTSRVYLSSLPKRFSFSVNVKLQSEADSGLVVSCLDMSELVESDLLIEQIDKNVKYHVLAMEDDTAAVGSIEQIFDTLKLMSVYAEANKPIQIHCYAGIARSAMMTALHISHQYLLGDEVVRVSLNNTAQLNVSDTDFIEKLYKAASVFVLSKRKCCRFDVESQNRLAILVLTTLNKKMQSCIPLVVPADDNYLFLATYVQSSEHKKIFKYISVAARNLMEQFFKAFISNQDEWYERLITMIESGSQDKKLLSGVLDAITRISEQYPSALYSQHVIHARSKRVNFTSLSC